MSRQVLARRHFLTLLAGALLAPRGRAWAAVGGRRTAAYTAEVGLLYDTLTLRLTGEIEETVDRRAGLYRLTAAGQGPRIANEIVSEGAFRGERWVPLRSHSVFRVAGRETRSEVVYDHTRRSIAYHHRGETFFLRRLRVADDVLAIPPGLHVDDVASAALNFAEGRWPPGPDGIHRTIIVRRQRPEGEGLDDVQRRYRAELAPLEVQVERDPDSGLPVGLLDLSGFSSWAREDSPAEVLFGPDRRPAALRASLMLGTRLRINLGGRA